MALKWENMGEEHRCVRMDGVIFLKIIVFKQFGVTKYHGEISGSWFESVGVFLDLEEAKRQVETAYLNLVRSELQSLLSELSFTSGDFL